MKKFKSAFIFSVAVHVLAVLIMLAVSGRGARATRSEVFYVQMMDVSGPRLPEASEGGGESSPPEPLPERKRPEVKISTEEQRREEEQQRREEEQQRREELERRRRELEDARRQREEEERARRERELAHERELSRLMEQLSSARSLGEFSSDAGAGRVPSSYVDAVYNRIYDSWEPVAGSFSPAFVSFRIHADGSVSSVTVTGSSGSSAYDESCRKAVLNAGPMPALPQNIGGEFINVRIRFNIKN